MSSEPRENKKICHFGGVYGHFEAMMGSWMCGGAGKNSGLPKHNFNHFQRRTRENASL